MFRSKTEFRLRNNSLERRTGRAIGFVWLALVPLLSFPATSSGMLIGGGSFDWLMENAETVVKAEVTPVNEGSWGEIDFKADIITVLKGDGDAIAGQVALKSAIFVWPLDLGVPFEGKQVVLLVLQRKEGKLRVVSNFRAILPATDSRVSHAASSPVARKVFDELLAFLPQAESPVAKGLVLVLMSQLASREDEEIFVSYLESGDEWLRRGALASLLRINPTPERVGMAVADFKNRLCKDPGNRRFWKMYKDVQEASRCGAWGMEKNMTARARAYLPIYRVLIDKAPPDYQRVHFAIKALKDVGTREDIGRLYRYLDHKVVWIRHDVMEGLGRILGMEIKRPSITSYMMPLPATVEPWEKETRANLKSRLFRYKNPIRSEAIGPIRDPQIIDVGDMYYLTGTTHPFWPGTICPGIRLWSSKDLLNWKFETFLIERSKLPEDIWYRDRFWASEIHQKNGKFWLTFNCRNESEKYPHKHSCGLAVADKITGPYTVLTHDKPLTRGNDMSLFTDDDGKTYAYYKWHWMQQIDLENARLVGQRRPIFTHKRDGWEKTGVEGMFVIKRGGAYYMFYSSWTRGYEVGYMTARHPLGPWKPYGGNPIYGAQDPNRCKEVGVQYTGDPNCPYYGVGHCTIFTGPDGRDWICAHHHMKGCGHKGSDIHLGFDPIWIEDGVIKTNGPTYTEQVVEIPVPRH